MNTKPILDLSAYYEMPQKWLSGFFLEFGNRAYWSDLKQGSHDKGSPFPEKLEVRAGEYRRGHTGWCWSQRRSPHLEGSHGRCPQLLLFIWKWGCFSKGDSMNSELQGERHQGLTHHKVPGAPQGGDGQGPVAFCVPVCV